MVAKFEKIISLFFIFLFFASFFFNPYPLEGGHQQRYNMYSSDEKRFVWFRVFKVASGSLKNIFQEGVADLTRTRDKILPEEFNDYFKFTFVRNPWDRVVSCYFHKVVTKRAKDFAECFGKDFDFFVDYINTLDVAKTNSHIKLQTRLVPVDKLDFIGNLDNFVDDLKYVCSVIGIECHEIPHRHKTNHAHYSIYYTDRTKNIIAEKYKEDIITFGFTFEKE